MTDTTSSSSTSERAALVREARVSANVLRQSAFVREEVGTSRALELLAPRNARMLADRLDRLVTALEAADADTRRLREALEWAMSEISDGAAYHDDNGIPEHDCEFSSNPEKGACDFHDRWVEAERLTGQHAARAAEEPTR